MPVLLDLFCGAGGAAMGYHRAGFEIVGIDFVPQPHYPFRFIQTDALDGDPERIATWADAAHASPPCHFASPLNGIWKRDYPNLIPRTRELLQATGLPYVIENVSGARAHLINPVMLCGSMFSLGANGRQLRRHRLFECSFQVAQPACSHNGQPVGVYGTGGGGQMTRGYKATRPEYFEAMGIDWMTKADCAQAIPPAYTEYIGRWLLRHLTGAQPLSLF